MGKKRHAFFDVTVACARKKKLERVKAVTRYDAKVLRIEECRNCERKYGSAVIMTKWGCFSSHDKARDVSDAPFQGRRTAAPSIKLTHIMRLSTGALEDGSPSSMESSISSTGISPSSIAEGILMS
jgi:hypothetical protein